MNQFETLIVEKKEDILYVYLNRPEVHNAINELMISELTSVYAEASKDELLRLVVLKGKGKSFCAGADLNYMSHIAHHSKDENYKDGQRLAKMFKTVYKCHVPTMAIVHGSAFGGANGLFAACDVVLADENTTFAFSEVKIGIGPATIMPFIIRRIGEYHARDLMLTGRKFKGKEAEKTGLINKAVPTSLLIETVKKYINEFITAAPKATRATKQLIQYLMYDGPELTELIDYTAGIIANLRADEEGQEGMAAFLEKRKPAWIKKTQRPIEFE
ncbi:MAG: enoyl-CoA hydratase [Bacteroidetes bacterium HGW-Bacteroidetes-16]|jgi:methylglutaconyl-CoA hydratase|nr:MAG: enoyl-CoA hydratase [Bacteroidetes bacterium HGW-Bacteroidetes-16]